MTVLDTEKLNAGLFKAKRTVEWLCSTGCVHTFHVEEPKPYVRPAYPNVDRILEWKMERRRDASSHFDTSHTETG